MSVQLHDQIRDYFSYVDEVQGSVDVTAVRHREVVAALDVRDRAAGESTQRRGGWRVAAVAFVAVILAVVLPLLLTRDVEPPVVDTVAPTTVAPAIESYYELNWTLVQGSPATPPVLRELIAETPSGLLIFDYEAAVPKTILRSVNGREWIAEPLPGGLRGFADLRQFGDTFLIVGDRGDRVFSSSDGSIWTEQSAEDWPDLVGVEYMGMDIETLSALTLPWATPNQNEANYVIEIDDRFVAFETRSTAEGVNSAFTSTDGLEWQQIAAPHFDELNLGNSIAFAVRDGVLMASGLELQDDGNGGTRLLRSTDGLTWTDVTPGAGVDKAQGIRAADSGWIAGGFLAGQVVSSRLYYSADGFEWIEIKVENDPFSTDHTHAAVAGDTLIRWDDDGFRGDYQIASLDTLELRSDESGGL